MADPIEDPSGSEPGAVPQVRELALFPLHSVLFPGAPLPLHIFEQRYREMIGRCLSSEAREFAVMLIKEGDEVVEGSLPSVSPGRAAVPHQIGTTARIMQAQQFPDGRYALLCTGQDRVRLRRLTQRAPYLVGEVELLLEADGPATSAELAQLVAHVHQAVARLLLAGVADGAPEARAVRERAVGEIVGAMPNAPIALSYFVPRVLSTVSAEQQQRLLEAPSAAERLRLALTLLEEDRALIEQLTPFSGPMRAVEGGQRPSLN